MKRLPTILFLCLVSIAAPETFGQKGEEWTEFAPAGDYFRVSLPQTPKAEAVTAAYSDLQVSGVWYSAGGEGTSFAIWSLIELNKRNERDADTYLDAAAEMFWQELLKPAREKLRDHLNRSAGVAYVKELSPAPLLGREYSVALGELSGTARVYISDHQIFVLLAADTPGAKWERERFFSSFKLSPEITPILRTGDPKVVGIGSGVMGESTIGSSQADQRPRILEKPEPNYTEGARMFGVQGTVVLRALFSESGEVKNIYVLRRLPHGLTERSIAAARAIKFVPAQKDGRAVSMYMQLEYNFNLF